VIATFIFGPGLRRQLQQAARDAFPRECCGLIEGRRGSTCIEATALHPAQNLAHEPDRFEIDPADHFRLQHAARARNAEIVGCYHSHPNGRPEPSARDHQGAGEAAFVWLIAALAAPETVSIGAFLFDGAGFRPLPIA
jgi:proteasome lid subunit RPN8/RPN11